MNCNLARRIFIPRGADRPARMIPLPPSMRLPFPQGADEARRGGDGRTEGERASEEGNRG